MTSSLKCKSPIINIYISFNTLNCIQQITETEISVYFRDERDLMPELNRSAKDVNGKLQNWEIFNSSLKQFYQVTETKLNK